MPRNASGIYTLPAGNPVVPGDTIDAAWANDTLSDLANEITNSLSRTGAGGMTAPFRLVDGTSSAPGLAFANEAGSGIYRASTGTVWLVIQGVPIAQITTNGLLLPTGKNLTVQGNGSVSGTFAVSGAATLGSTLSVTGVLTATGGVAGNVTGNVTSTGTSTFDTVVVNATLDMTNGVISNVATPVADGDAANKAYVDNIAQGIDAKASCAAATTANITLSGTQTIDGVAVTAGQRVLVKNQTSAAENGIYVAAAGAWSRAADANTWDELVSAFTFIEGGTANGNNGYLCTVAAGGTLGVTAVTWTQFSGAGQITAGAGMTKSGNTLDVGTASSSRIVVNADNIDLATTGVSAGTYKSVTVDVYGRVTAGTNPTTLAGYGITDAYTTTYIDTLFGTTASAATSAAAAASSASAAATSATNASNSAASALSSLNTFKGQYYGPLAADPTVDPLGNAMNAGDLYYNTAANEMRFYSGSAWVAAYIPTAGLAVLASANTFTANQTITANTSSDALKITQTGSGNALYIEDVAADATPFVVSSTGVVGIGTTTPDNVTSAGIALVSNDGYYPQLVTRNKANDANASYVVFDKDRAGAVVQSGDNLGNIIWRSFDGTSYLQSAAIIAYSDATPGTNDVPGAIAFLTTADGASAPTERLRISNAGAAIFRNAITETVYSLSGTALNPANGTIQTKTLGANTTLTDSLSDGQAMTLMIDDGSAYAITWPTMTWKTDNGNAPTLNTTGYTVVVLWKVGSTLYGARVGNA